MSAIICTRNRATYLASALESLRNYDNGSDFFEIVVVDNASSDRTKDYVCSLARQDSVIKYVSEPILGLSRARNTGIRSASGRYIAFLDDDAVAEPGWLSQVLIAFDTGGPDVGCVAGKIAPAWAAPPPLWLHDELLCLVGVLDYGPAALWLRENQVAIGCNAAYPRDAVLQAGGFSPALGRKGSLLISNEEVLLQRQLGRLGYRTYYDPKMAVRHTVHAERLSKSWFRRRAYWQGVSDALVERQFDSMTRLTSVDKGLRQLVSLAKRPIELASLIDRGDDAPAFLAACRILSKVGYSLASLGSATSRSPGAREFTYRPELH